MIVIVLHAVRALTSGSLSPEYRVPSTECPVQSLSGYLGHRDGKMHTQDA